jgi:hypothetical protein
LIDGTVLGWLCIHQIGLHIGPKHWQHSPFPHIAIASKQEQHQQQVAIKAEKQNSVCVTNICYNELAVLMLIILILVNVGLLL